MPVTQNAKKYHEKMFPGYESDFLRTDPEFISITGWQIIVSAITIPGLDAPMRSVR